MTYTAEAAQRYLWNLVCWGPVGPDYQTHLPAEAWVGTIPLTVEQRETLALDLGADDAMDATHAAVFQDSTGRVTATFHGDKREAIAVARNVADAYAPPTMTDPYAPYRALNDVSPGW